MKDIYNKRSDVIHGKKPFQEVPVRIQKDTFLFARKSLQQIICEEKSFIIFSKNERESKEELKKFFLSLDL